MFVNECPGTWTTILMGCIYEVSMLEMMLSSTRVPQESVLAHFLFTVHMIDFQYNHTEALR